MTTKYCAKPIVGLDREPWPLVKGLRGGGGEVDQWPPLEAFHYTSHPPQLPLPLDLPTIPAYTSTTGPKCSATMAPAFNTTNGNPGTSLTADYASPTDTKTFTHPLPCALNTSTKEKTEYLSALRKSVVKLQEEVNGFLTTKMEEDKSLAASAGVKADERGEEENYGEENVEDES